MNSVAGTLPTEEADICMCTRPPNSVRSTGRRGSTYCAFADNGAKARAALKTRRARIEVGVTGRLPQGGLARAFPGLLRPFPLLGL